MGGVTGLKVTCFPVQRKPCDSFLALSLSPSLWPLTSMLTPEWKPAALLVEHRDGTTEEEWCQFSHSLMQWWRLKLVLLFVLFTQTDPPQRQLYCLPYLYSQRVSLTKFQNKTTTFSFSCSMTACDQSDWFFWGLTKYKRGDDCFLSCDIRTPNWLTNLSGICQVLKDDITFLFRCFET